MKIALTNCICKRAGAIFWQKTTLRRLAPQSKLSVPIYSSKDNHLFATLSLTGMSVTIARRKKEIYPKLAEVARRLQQTIDF